MDGIVIISILLIGGLLMKKVSHKGTSGMSDPAVTIDNIRRGVARGWYTCRLTRISGQPAVELSGKQTTGDYTTDVYPVSEADWQTLKNEGFPVV